MYPVFAAILVIFAAFAGWVAVQALGRAYAHRHPDQGAFREEGAGCQGCTCKNYQNCTNKSARSG